MELAPLLLAPGLRKKGQQVSIWADPDSFLGRKAREAGFLTQSFRYSGHFHPGRIRETWRALNQEQPDLIHLHHTRDLWTVVPALALAGWKGPLVVSKHVASSVVKKGFFHRRLYGRVDLMLACSEYIRKNVIDTCPMAPDKVQTAFVPVDLKAFRSNTGDRRRVRKSWGWESKKIIGMVARVSPKKGQELFLRTAARLMEKIPGVRFRVAGAYSPDEQWFSSQMLDLRKKLGLEDVFVYEGMVKDVPGFLSAVDLVVHMADAESFGMAVAEALACEKPVVVRRGGGVAEILEREPGKAHGGLVLDSDDPEEWADTLAGVLKSKSSMAKFQREARKTAQRFSLEPWVDRHLQWYRQILNHKSP